MNPIKTTTIFNLTGKIESINRTGRLSTTIK